MRRSNASLQRQRRTNDDQAAISRATVGEIWEDHQVVGVNPALIRLGLSAGGEFRHGAHGEMSVVTAVLALTVHLSRATWSQSRGHRRRRVLVECADGGEMRLSRHQLQ